MSYCYQYVLYIINLLLMIQDLIKSKSRSTAFASEVKIDKTMGIQWLSNI